MGRFDKIAHSLVKEILQAKQDLQSGKLKFTDAELRQSDYLIGLLERVFVKDLKGIVMAFDSSVSDFKKKSGKDPFQMPNVLTILSSFNAKLYAYIIILKRAAEEFGSMYKKDNQNKDLFAENVAKQLIILKDRLVAYKNTLIAPQSEKVYANSEEARKQFINSIAPFEQGVISALEAEKRAVGEVERKIAAGPTTAINFGRPSAFKPHR
jgi:hypothetical protein